MSISVSVLPFNLAFDWQKTTLDTLRALQEDQNTIQAHIAANMAPAATLGALSLFRTVLAVREVSTSEDEVLSCVSRTQGVQADMIVLAQPIGQDVVQLDVRFASQSISQVEIIAFLDHMSSALDSMKRDLSSLLRDVDLVSPREKQRLVYEINPVGSSSTSVQSITELLEAQAQKTPNKIAVRPTRPSPSSLSLMFCTCLATIWFRSIHYLS